MAETLLPVQSQYRPPPLCSFLLNHEVWNINGLIIPAESEIKGIAFFYCIFLTDGDLILHYRGTDKGILRRRYQIRKKSLTCLM